MRLLVLLPALFAAVTEPANPQAAAVVAAVTGPRIEAHEIAAVVDGWRPANPQADLAPSPPPGSPRRISRALLESWTTVAGAEVASLPESIVVQRQTAPLTREKAAAIVGAAIARRVDHDLAAIEVQVALNQELPAPPAGDLEWSLIGRAPEAGVEALLRLRWRDAGGRTGIEAISASVQARGEWLAAVRDIPARQAVSAADFRLEQGKLPSLRAVYPSSLQQDQTFELKRSLNMDEPLRAELLRARPDVSRGDVLQLEVRSGLVALSAPARAEADARVGESIRLKNLETGRVIVGRVLSPETAEAVLP